MYRKGRKNAPNKCTVTDKKPSTRIDNCNTPQPERALMRDAHLQMSQQTTENRNNMFKTSKEGACRLDLYKIHAPASMWRYGSFSFGSTVALLA